MKKTIKSTITTLFMCMLLIPAIPIFASSTPSSDNVKIAPKIIEEHKIGPIIGPETYNKVFEEIGITKDEFISAQKDGKTLFDLSKSKGFTENQIREMLIKYESEFINEAVKNGTISQEQSEERINKLKERISEWDGNLKCFSEKHTHNKLDILSNIKDLNITEEELLKAKDSNKTLFDLEKEKNNLTPDQVKSIIITEKTNHINEKVKTGEISKETGDKIIQNITSKINSWDGNLNPKK